MKLKNRIAIVTGARKGLGRSIALAFAREGAKLVLPSASPSDLEEVVEEARRMKREAITVQCDVTNEADVKRMVQQTADTFSRIDILVNNSYIVGPTGPFSASSPAEWVAAIDRNLKPLAVCCHAVLPVMMRQRLGTVINVTGIGSSRPAETLSAYSVSMTAVARFSELLAVECIPHNIQVNALLPGQYDTPLVDEIIETGEDRIAPRILTDVRRAMSSDGVALEQTTALAVWLASDDSDGLTGRIVTPAQDDPRNLPRRIPFIMRSDSHTLRFVP